MDKDLPDGTYRTHAIHSPPTAIRVITIKQGMVYLGGHTFTQPWFFKVNALLN